MTENIQQRILKYLIENPGATPREIADNIGISISKVRRILYMLRDKGLVRRVGTGYTAIRIDMKGGEQKEIEEQIGQEQEKQRSQMKEYERERVSNLSRLDYTWLYEIISKITKTVNELSNRVDRIEKELNELKGIIGKQSSKRETIKKTRVNDQLIKLLKLEKIVTVKEALNYATKPLEDYVNKELAIVFKNYIIDKEFYDGFKNKFPLTIESIKKLTEKEKLLLKLLIEEGLVYLHAGREYKLTE